MLMNASFPNTGGATWSAIWQMGAEERRSGCIWTLCTI